MPLKEKDFFYQYTAPKIDMFDLDELQKLVEKAKTYSKAWKKRNKGHYKYTRPNTLAGKFLQSLKKSSKFAPEVVRAVVIHYLEYTRKVYKDFRPFWHPKYLFKDSFLIDARIAYHTIEKFRNIDVEQKFWECAEMKLRRGYQDYEEKCIDELKARYEFLYRLLTETKHIYINERDLQEAIADIADAKDTVDRKWHEIYSYLE